MDNRAAHPHQEFPGVHPGIFNISTAALKMVLDSIDSGDLLVNDETVFDVPYYRKLTLHEIKVLEINAT